MKIETTAKRASIDDVVVTVVPAGGNTPPVLTVAPTTASVLTGQEITATFTDLAPSPSARFYRVNASR